MKKTIAVTAAFLLSCSAMSMNAFAAEDTDAKVYVTISDGELALVQEEVTVTDADNDGALTINDALLIAHNEKFEGGAEAGYASSVGDYGLMLNKLWGVENGGSYGYYVNDKSANSLADTISSGDHINAFVYQDTSSWSDTYCFFDKDNAEAECGEEVELVLSKAAFDADWNPVTLPVDGAVITVNGEPTDFITDADGKVTVKFEKAGTIIVSAVSDKETLVPPALVAEVSGEAENDDNASDTDTTGASDDTAEENADGTAGEESDGAADEEADEEADDEVVYAGVDDEIPATGDAGAGLAFAFLGTAAAVAFAARRRNED